MVLKKLLLALGIAAAIGGALYAFKNLGGGC
jgi:hypothetical protein